MKISDSIKNRSDLKSYFVKNAIPTESNFAELIDSTLNQLEDGLLKTPGSPLSIEATGDASSQKKVLNLFASISDEKPRWVLSLNPRTDPARPETARAGFGIGDADGASRLFIDERTGRVGVGTVEPADSLDVREEVRLLSGSNPLRVTGAWSEFTNGGPNHAEISNDTDRFKALMIFGNQSAGGNVRRVAIGDELTVHGDLVVGGTQRFSGGIRQVLDLFEDRYGIGVQSSTVYFRSASDFAWYKGGAHDGAALSPGAGGVVQMVVNNGHLGIGTTTPVKEIHVQQGGIGAPLLNHPARPGMALTGQYPELTLFSRVNNARHGATIRLGSYDGDEGEATKQWVMGTAGRDSTFLDFGFSATNNGNPHNGIRGYSGTTVLTLLENGNVGVGHLTPTDKLFVNGTIRSLGGIKVDGNLAAHPETDGSLYRFGGQVYITVDDNLYIRDMRGGVKFHFDTNAGIVHQPGWRGVAFQNGWRNYGSGYNGAAYFKDSLGIVHLRGLVRGGTIRKDIFVLPAGFRPAGRELHAVMTNSGIGRVDVLTDGRVYPERGGNTWFGLDGVTFRAAR